MGPNLPQCRVKFAENTTLQHAYHYNGSVGGVLNKTDGNNFITIAGCLDICGSGYSLYDPFIIINTVTTWILPTIGLLLQAPYSSNSSWPTIFALLRWLGSPISSLTSVLWNIKVLSKCALMVDMAVVSAQGCGPDSSYAAIRDSFYILSVMNQFEIPADLPDSRIAANLLRVALFSNKLDIEGDRNELPQRRKILAEELRSRGRRGTVPVFVSMFWFFLALAISIYLAFGDLGERATALNLALGLSLGWMPVFILACIVDRNPYSTETVRELLNDFLERVAEGVVTNPNSCLDEPTQHQNPGLGQLVDGLVERDGEHFKGFFRSFSGQGRVRWHFGVAHPILADVEDDVVIPYGRGWLIGPEVTGQGHRERKPVRDVLILGQSTNSATRLQYIKKSEFWQGFQAFCVVWGTMGGAFTIAYCTPTYGLGCRSGGFLIYMVLALASAVFELIGWLVIRSRYTGDQVNLPLESPRSLWYTRFGRFLKRFLKRLLKPFLKLILKFFRPVFFPLLDLAIATWLIYITFAQTFGVYETCACVGSAWGANLHMPGGYIDLLSVVAYKANGIESYWWQCTGLTIGIVSIAIVHIVSEWCTQSHLSTENFDKALDGLKWTRMYKLIFHTVPYALWNRLVRRWRDILMYETKRDTLIWTPITRSNWTRDDLPKLFAFFKIANIFHSDSQADHSTELPTIQSTRVANVPLGG